MTKQKNDKPKRKKTFKNAESLQDCVAIALGEYFKNLEGEPPANLYQLLLTQMERPLLAATLEKTNNNQSVASEYLGISRGTLRKKLKDHNLS